MVGSGILNMTSWTKRPQCYIIVILLETGLRISELCGLTIHDVNLQEKTLSVSKQLCVDNRYGGSGKLYIESTKSSAGERIVPLSKKAIECFESIIKNRRKVKFDPVVDGYSGFIFIRDNGEPKYGAQYTEELNYILKKYNSNNPDHLIQKLSPHVLRHTFCTNMLNAGLNIKSLQYIMGHSTANITLNVYSHSSSKTAVEHFRKLENRNS
ncbi:MAG: site-specific integrase [Angelakisella sp.]